MFDFSLPLPTGTIPIDLHEFSMANGHQLTTTLPPPIKFNYYPSLGSPDEGPLPPPKFEYTQAIGFQNDHTLPIPRFAIVPDSYPSIGLPDETPPPKLYINIEVNISPGDSPTPPQPTK
jgi:hypothetical protein